MQLFVCEVDAVDNAMSRSTTSTAPSKPSCVRNQAIDEPIAAPPTMTTS